MDPSKNVINRKSASIGFSYNTTFTSATSPASIQWTERFTLGFKPDVAVIRTVCCRAGTTANLGFTNGILGISTSLDPNSPVSVMFPPAGTTQYPRVIDLRNVSLEQVHSFQVMMVSVSGSPGARASWIPVNYTNAGALTYINVGLIIEFIEFEKKPSEDPRGKSLINIH